MPNGERQPGHTHPRQLLTVGYSNPPLEYRALGADQSAASIRWPARTPAG